MNPPTLRAARCGVWMALAILSSGALQSKLALAADESKKTNVDAVTVIGTVVKIDAGDVVVDIGAKKGALEGDALELWRPITVKHPVTGKLLTDRFRIGGITLTQVGEVMSLAKAQGSLLRPVEAGDVVVLQRAPKVGLPIANPKEKTAVVLPTPEVSGDVVYMDDPEARALSALFEGLTGQPIETRIERYESWAKAHPESRFVPVLLEEATHLRSFSGPCKESAPKQVDARSFQAPTEVLAGSSFTMALEIGGQVEGAILQLRIFDEPSFTPMPMQRVGPGYYSVIIPQQRVVGPSLSYFVEAVVAEGSATAIVGSASSPNEIHVLTRPSIKPPSRYESIVSLWTDYADYNRLRGNDYASQTEGFFGMRFSDIGLRAVRSGFGVYKGKGGGVTDLDADNPALRRDPRTVGLSYGYIEGEFGLSATFGLIARAVVGLGEDGVTGGGQAFIRIGNDKKTNFMIGGEFLGGVGIRGISQVELNMFPRIPILLRSEVTNQPAGTTPTSGNVQRLAGKSVAVSDLGIRAIVQAGYRVTPTLTIFLRGSYQGRTINHAGPGGGAGMTFTW